MSVTFTVLLAVTRSPELLPYAIDSVLAQERRDFELAIICDGAPQETVDCARAFAGRDQRIRVHVHPKGERFGELYRHQALDVARGAYVCQICDDDLWLPNHLTEMGELLREFEFGNLLEIHIRADGSPRLVAGDLALAPVREAMRTQRYSFFSPTVAGYRLATYRRLPVGWAPGPADVWHDLHMWRKFLALPGVACGTRIAFTSVQFPTTSRRDWSIQRRVEETRIWARRLQDPAARDRLAQHFLLGMMRAEMLQLERKSRSVKEGA